MHRDADKLESVTDPREKSNEGLDEALHGTKCHHGYLYCKLTGAVHHWEEQKHNIPMPVTEALIPPSSHIQYPSAAFEVPSRHRLQSIKTLAWQKDILIQTMNDTHSNTL